MKIWTAAIRLFFLVTLSVYLGGFTFYSAVVIPILHDRLESPLETGLITQRVTNVLNSLGLMTLSSGWCVFGSGYLAANQSDRGGRFKIWLLVISSVCLIALFVLHRVLDHNLEAGTTTGFYLFHRAYLWTSTVQCFANLGLLVQSTGVFTQSPVSRP